MRAAILFIEAQSSLQRELGYKLRLKLLRKLARGLKQQPLLRLLQKLNAKQSVKEKQLVKPCER